MRKNDVQRKKVFTTLDAYLSGYLVLKECTPSLIQEDNSNKIVFVFPATEELYTEITNYNNGAKVEAVRFALAIKGLKSKIFSLRRNNVNELFIGNQRLP